MNAGTFQSSSGRIIGISMEARAGRGCEFCEATEVELFGASAIVEVELA